MIQKLPTSFFTICSGCIRDAGAYRTLFAAIEAAENQGWCWKPEAKSWICPTCAADERHKKGEDNALVCL